MPHSLWNGTVAFATVHVPVKLYAATESKMVRFRERHLTDGAAIEHRRVCIEEDREVPYREIVKGVETSSGRYLVLTKEEIAAADGPAARTIEVEHFVRREEIDPLYYAHVYYLGPGAYGEDGYRLLHGAMKRSDRVGIGRFVFHNKAQLVAMRALGEVIALHTMRFADEIVPPHAPGAEDAAQRPSRRETQVASTLVEQLASPFQPRRYKDTYRDAVLNLIARKARGETIDLPQQEQEAGAGDLLAALQESVRMHSGARRRRTADRRSQTAPSAASGLVVPSPDSKRAPGGKRTAPTPGGKRTAPTPDGKRTAPTPGDKRTAPTPGDKRTAPTPGGKRTAPAVGRSKPRGRR